MRYAAWKEHLRRALARGEPMFVARLGVVPDEPVVEVRASVVESPGSARARGGNGPVPRPETGWLPP
ncbi:hypothetical protein [Streptomyces sp. NPDC001508]|uniref:hypothetical protein n=1 Tax=Streptomyces sp. NPDC001508 TaxID=3154656 RepID=UPI00332D3BCA